MDEVATATLVAGRGVAGSADQGGRRQVTIIDATRWRELLDELQVALDPSARRANLLIEGLDLTDSRGRTLVIGDARIRIVGETRPCERMDDACEGLQRAMRQRWGGGVFGQVLTGGIIAAGTAVRWL
jgi:MOSC domain-containing protein YiiM